MILERYTLPNGLTVLARTNQAGMWGPMTYTNQTQAERKLHTLRIQGVTAHIYHPQCANKSRIRYIVIDD